jgi:hypothetical protein
MDTLILFTIAILLLLPLLLKVKRLWGFYLHNGIVFLLLGFFVLCEKNLLTSGNKKNITKILTLILIGLIMTVNILFSFPHIYKSYIVLSKRTKSDNYIQKINEYNYLINFLEKTHNQINRKLNVYYDPGLFLITSNDKYNIRRFWGPFLYWDEGFDLVILYPEQILNISNNQKTNIFFEKKIEAKELYYKYVNQNNENYSESIVYNIFDSEIPTIQILIKSDIAKILK